MELFCSGCNSISWSIALREVASGSNAVCNQDRYVKPGLKLDKMRKNTRYYLLIILIYWDNIKKYIDKTRIVVYYYI